MQIIRLWGPNPGKSYKERHQVVFGFLIQAKMRGEVRAPTKVDPGPVILGPNVIWAEWVENVNFGWKTGGGNGRGSLGDHQG